MRALLRSVFLVGFSTVANTGVSVIRNKLLAVALGPTGVGLFAQLAGFQSLAASIVPLGLQTGALRYVARYRRGDAGRLAAFMGSASRLFLALSVVGTLLCLLLIRPLALWATDSLAYVPMLIAPILGIPFLVQTQTWLIFVQSGLDMRAYSRALILTSISGLLVLVPLVLVWRLEGAAVHLLVFAVLGWGIARWSAHLEMEPEMRRSIAAAPADRSALQSLWKFGAANFLPFVVTMAFPFTLRAQIVRDCGLMQNGIYQALFAVSIQYLGIPLNAMTAYSFPRISQLKDPATINEEVNSATRVAVLFSAAGILLILLARDIVIRVFFSSSFLEASRLFPVQLVGDLIRSMSFALQLPLLAQERHRARNLLIGTQYATFAAIFFAVPPEHRLWGAVWGHTVSWGVHLVMHVAYMRRVNGFRFSPDNVRLLATSFAAVAAVALMPFPDWRWRAAGVVVAALWAMTAMTRREVERVMVEVRTRLRAAPAPGREGENV